MDQPLARIKAQDNGTELVGADGERHWELLTKRGWAHLELYADRLVHTGREPREIALRDVVSVETAGKHNSRAIWPKTFVLVRYRDVDTERIAGWRLSRRRHAEAWCQAIDEAAQRVGS